MRPELEPGVAPLRRALAPRRRRSRRALWLRLAWRLLATGLLLGAVAWLMASPRFAVQRVVVAGVERIDRSAVESRLTALHGRPLLALDWSEVRQTLGEQPWLAGLSIHKVLPSTLEVRLEERLPVALFQLGEELVYLDREGLPIAPYRPTSGEEPPLLLRYRHPLPVPVALVQALVDELSAAAPEWAAELSEVEPLGGGDARVISAALPCPVLLRRGRVATAVDRLAGLLPALSQRLPSLAVIDSRFEDRIIVRPGGRLPASSPAVAPTAPTGRGGV